MIKVDNLVNFNQEVQEELTELTGKEMSEMKGGYAGIVAAATDPGLGIVVGGLVFGQPVSDPLTLAQRRIGVPRAVVEGGVALANRIGGGTYTGPVTAAKLG
jgi:hypothetical protein